MVKKPKPSDKIPVVVSVKLDHNVLPEERTVIEQINRKYGDSQILLEFSDDNLIGSLYRLDPSKYQEDLFSIIKKIEVSRGNIPDLINPFQELLEKINSIGSYGIRYGKRIYAGYADERKVVNRKEKESARETYFYARENSFRKEKNFLTSEYINKIYCGDSEEILKSFPDNCIDLIITSPPYNFGLEYSSTGDSSHWQAYLDKLWAVFSEGIRVLSYGGRFIVNVQPLFSDYIPLHHMVSNFFINKKMIWKGEILWEKNNYNCKYTSWGSWKSPSSPYLKYTWEFIEIFCKGSLKKEGESSNIDINDEEFKKWVVAKWSLGTEKRMKEFQHPAMFPEELVERCLKLFSYKDDVILDPFNGAGTTTTVASKLNRRYIGIDISPVYCICAEKRLLNNKPVKSREEKIQPSKINNKPDLSKGLKRRGRPTKKDDREKKEDSQEKLNF